MYLEREHNFENKLMSHTFKQIWNTLDNIMKERTAEGIPGRSQHEYVSES